MSSLADRLPRNRPGRFYVDASCVDCDLCRSTAPAFFARDEETGLSFVHRQPATPAEAELAAEAVAGCPTQSIGDDGA